MNIVYFSPHFPDNYISFVEELSKLNVNVLGIADTAFEDLPERLRSSLTAYYKVSDLENYDELVKAMGYFTYRFGKIDHIDSQNEYWLATEAQLRTDFNIPGLKSDVIWDMKFKSRMKQRFVRAGINVARGMVIDNLEAARKFAGKVGFPVIAKPDSGVGAMGTFKINDEEQLLAFFKNDIDTPYIFEEFISGQIHSFDGLTDKNGKIIFYTSHIYSDGIMDVVNKDEDVYYYSQRSVPRDLVNAGKKILREFDYKGRFFHFEFFRTEKGQLVALEVNMRPPGGFTTDMFNFGSDINVYELWAKIVTNQHVDLDYKRKFHVAYVGRKYRFDYLNDLEKIKDHCGKYLSHHENISGIFSRALGDYGFLVRHPNLDVISKYIEFIRSKK